MFDHRRLTRERLSAVVVAAVICAAAVGCEGASGTNPDANLGSLSTSPATSSAPAAPTTTSGASNAPVDYSRLLLQASDLSDDEDTFTVQSTNPVPGGLPGASALFVNQEDTRAISDTIAVYPDAATATKTLRESIPRLDQVVADATPRPAPVGADGTMAVGKSVDGSKAVTLLLFTQGPALVRLEFQSAPGDATTDEFVINVGKMQDISLRAGLSTPE